MLPRPLTLRARASATALLLLAVVASAAGCGALVETPPAPTPADFQGIAADFVKRGIRIDNIVSGDAGCDDVELARTAIGLDAVGLDQTSPTRVYVYIFRNRDAYNRLRQTVDACARSYVTDPEAFASVEESPFVVAGPGPWAPDFHAALRAALVEAAGTGD
ncbi:MAG TPA: hypothetical protein VFO05_07835 [Candidatus Limnocylindrales bacterium]|nr:hypothetical protein [Candidatus Limnocylindrales bacterium]